MCIGHLVGAHSFSKCFTHTSCIDVIHGPCHMHPGRVDFAASIHPSGKRLSDSRGHRSESRVCPLTQTGMSRAVSEGGPLALLYTWLGCLLARTFLPFPLALPPPPAQSPSVSAQPVVTHLVSRAAVFSPFWKLCQNPAPRAAPSLFVKKIGTRVPCLNSHAPPGWAFPLHTSVTSLTLSMSNLGLQEQLCRSLGLKQSGSF